VEELQLQKIVHRIYTDEKFRYAMFADPRACIEQEQVSPAVARVLERLIPRLSLGSPLGPPMWWWHP
jgi:hypothetical protein